jgi:hypothetical protein
LFIKRFIAEKGFNTGMQTTTCNMPKLKDCKGRGINLKIEQFRLKFWHFGLIFDKMPFFDLNG